MSEIDRLSNSGLYPALPIPDKQRKKDESAGKPPPDPRAAQSGQKTAGSPDAGPRPPKSIIDEYA